jgi:hypothetical protein
VVSAADPPRSLISVPDPLLLRKSGSAGNRTWDLGVSSQELWPIDYRGGHRVPTVKFYVKKQICWWKPQIHFILSSRVCPYFLTNIFPSVSPQSPLNAFMFSLHACYMPCEYPRATIPTPLVKSTVYNVSLQTVLSPRLSSHL